MTLVILFPFLFSSLLNKRGEEKENDLAKIVIKGHAFLLDPRDRKNSKCEIEKKGLKSDFTVCIMFCNL